LAVAGGIDIGDVRFRRAVRVEIDEGDARVGRLATAVDRGAVPYRKASLREQLDRLFGRERGLLRGGLGQRGGREGKTEPGGRGGKGFRHHESPDGDTSGKWLTHKRAAPEAEPCDDCRMGTAGMGLGRGKARSIRAAIS